MIAVQPYVRNIRDLREDADKTQAEIAQVLRVSRMTYARYEHGESELPLCALVDLCRYYGKTADYMLGFTPRR